MVLLLVEVPLLALPVVVSNEWPVMFVVPVPSKWGGGEVDPVSTAEGAVVAFCAAASLGRIVRSRVPSTLGESTRKTLKRMKRRRRRERWRGLRLAGVQLTAAAQDNAAFRIGV